MIDHAVLAAWPRIRASDVRCHPLPDRILSLRRSSGSKGNLAPFNEELTFNFRGPLNLFNIAVYQPDSSGATWTQTSSWAAGQAPNNLVFMNNLGGGASGEFSSTSGFKFARTSTHHCAMSLPTAVCHGNSQSFASGDFTAAVATANADISNGVLDQDHEIVRLPMALRSPSDGH